MRYTTWYCTVPRCRRTSTLPRAVAVGAARPAERGFHTMRRLETNQRKQTRSCDVDSTFRCDDVNCNRRKLCSRVELAKRRMMGHDRKTKAARRFAWGADYNSYRNRITQGVLILVLSTLFATTARTHDYKRPSLDQWYGSLQRPHMSPHGGGASCCSKEDCHTTEAELRNGEWWARLGKPIDQAGQRDWELARPPHFC